MNKLTFQKWISILLVLTILILPVFTMSGCDHTGSQWNYTAEDAEEFVEEEAYYSTTDGVTSFVVEMEKEFFNDSLSQNDVIIFDYTQLATDDSNGKITEEYYSYSTISKYQITPDTFDVTNDGIGFCATFSSSSTDVFCALINKSAVTSGQYVYFYGEPGNEVGGENSKLSSVAKSAWDVAKTELKILSAVAALYTQSTKPTGDFFKISGSMTSLFDIVAKYAFADYSDGSLSEKDMLKSIEGKIDDLTTSVNAAAEKLQNVSDQILIQVDRINVNTLKNSVNSFFTDYTQEVDKYLAILQDYQYLYVKDFIQSPENITLYYNQGDDGKYESVTEQEFDTKSGLSYTITLSTFNNAAANLKANGNKITEGFTTALYADFNENLKSTDDKPSSSMRSEAELDLDIFNAIVQEFYQNYYSGSESKDENIKKAQEIRNLADKYMKMVGGIGVDSILSSYRDLLMYSFNFAQECKDDFIDLCDNFVFVASKLGSLAEIASFYNDNNVILTDLESHYDTALNKIIDYQDQFESLDDNYNFVNKTVTKGTFVCIGLKEVDFYTCTNPSMTIVDFSQLDVNFPQVEYLDEYYNSRYVSYDFTNDSDLPYSFYSTEDLARMYGRYDIMNTLGYFQGQTINNFFDYIISRHVIDSTAVKKFVSRGSKGADAKFATGFTKRKLTNADKVSIYCGFAYGKKFSSGQSYVFESKGKEKYWIGYTVESTFFYHTGKSGKDYAASTAEYLSEGSLFKSLEFYNFNSASYCFILYSDKS